MAVYSLSDRFTPNVPAAGGKMTSGNSATMGFAREKMTRYGVHSGDMTSEAKTARFAIMDDAVAPEINLLANISLELRAPLAQISAPLQQLQNSDGTLSECERKRLYGIIGLYTSRMLDLVDQLLDSRQAGQASPAVPPAVPGQQPGGSQSRGPEENNRPELLLTPKGRRSTTYDDELLNKLIHLMEQNLEETDFNVHKMCSMMHMSHMHFIRKVKQLTGKKPIDLLKSYRLKRAKDLLRMNKLTVAEIAYKVGYDMPNSFSRAFKKEFGISPSEYTG